MVTRELGTFILVIVDVKSITDQMRINNEKSMDMIDVKVAKYLENLVHHC